eukprot:8373248-Ditylum_brightwellii.AAC.1
MLTKTTFTAPSAGTTVDESTHQIVLQKEVKAFIRRRESYEQAKETYYSIAMGQHTGTIRAKLESESRFVAIARDLNLIELLRLLKDLSFNYQSQKYPFLSVYLTMRSFYLMHQKESVPCNKYLETFANQKGVIEHIGRSVASHPGLNRLMLKEAGIDVVAGASTNKRAKAAADTKEAYMAIVFLASATRAKYGRLLKELANNYLKGADEYPRTMVAAHKLPLNYQNNPCNHAHVTTASNKVAFVTEGEVNEESDSGKEVHEGNSRQEW